MNKWFFIIGGFAIVMVIFGNNPLEKKEKPQSGDKLLNAIDAYQNPTDENGGKSTFKRMLGAGQSFGGTGTASRPMFPTYGNRSGGFGQPRPPYQAPADRQPGPGWTPPDASGAFQIAPPSRNIPGT